MEKNPLVKYLNRVVTNLPPDIEVTVAPAKVTPVARDGVFYGIAVNIEQLGRSTLFTDLGHRVPPDIIPQDPDYSFEPDQISSILSNGRFNIERIPLHSELPLKHFLVTPFIK